MKKTIRLAIGLAFAALFLWLIFRRVDFSELAVAIEGLNYQKLALAVVLLFVGFGFRIHRWQIMLKTHNPELKWMTCAGPFMASIAANNVLPFRMGDVIRAFAFNRTLNITAATSVASLLVERLLDILMLLCFLGGSLIFFRAEYSHYFGFSGSFLILGGLAILLFLLFSDKLRSLTLWAIGFGDKLLPDLTARVKTETAKIFDSLHAVSSLRTMFLLIFWSFVSWLAEGGVYWLVASSMPSVTNDIASWLAFPIATLATTIPSAPGYIGTFDYFASEPMVILGNSVTAAAAFAFLLHAVLWLPVTLVGGIYFISEKGLTAIKPRSIN